MKTTFIHNPPRLVTVFDFHPDTPAHDRRMIKALYNVLDAIDFDCGDMDYCEKVHAEIMSLLRPFNLRVDYIQRDAYGRAYIVTNK